MSTNEINAKIRAHNRLNELEALEDGWLDGYGDKMTSSSLILARQIIDSLDETTVDKFGIYPHEAGSMGFENSEDLSENLKIFYSIETQPEGEVVELFAMVRNSSKELPKPLYKNFEKDTVDLNEIIAFAKDPVSFFKELP